MIFVKKKLFLILILAFILRLPFLNGSLWLDEAAQAIESSRPFAEQLMIREDFQPPLMHYLLHFSIQIGKVFNLERSEWWLRLFPSLIPGIITIWASFKIAQDFFDKKTATLASIFLATSSFHVFFSQELRPYSLPAMWGLLSIYQMLLIFKEKKQKNLVLFTIFSILGLYSSYLYPFLLASQFIYLLARKLELKKIITMAVTIIFSFLPWLPKFWEQLETGQELRLEMPGWDQVVSLPQIKSLVIVPFKFVFGLLDLKANLFYAIASLVIFASLAWLSWKLIQKKKHQKEQLFFATILLLPLIAAWIVSFFVPVLRAKRVLFLLPIFSLLEAFLISTFSKKQKLISQILLFSILLINSISLISYWKNPKLQREDWRSLVREVESKFPANKSIVLFSFKEAFAPWRWYQTGEIDTLSSGEYYFKDLENPAEHFKFVSDYDYVLIPDYLRDLTDPEDQIIKVVEDLGFEGKGVIDYPNIGFTRIYIKNSANLALESDF
jgi:uncharacterized membrane protein